MDSATNNVQHVTMLPPQPGTFKNREELIGYVRNFALNHGFMVTITQSKPESVRLGCDRGGTTRRRSTSEPKRKRKVPSRLINCPFEVVGRKDKDEDDDVWILQVRNGKHNHEPLEDMSEHPRCRRFSEDELRQIKEMIEAGVKPREVMETLKQSNPKLKSTPKQVYNLATRIRQGKFSETSFNSVKPTNKIKPLKVSNFIGGNFVNSEGNVCTDVVNPATQEVVSQVPSATYEEFKSAVFAAKQAFPSWRKTTLSARQRIVIKLLELIRRDIDKLASVISTEQGETIKRAHAGIVRSLEVVEHACGNRALQMGEFLPNASTGIDMYSIREPLGVCAGICGCSYPAVSPLWMFPISIICGNTFVLSPSEKSPGALLKLAELAVEAGLPDGVLNIIHGGNEVVDHICGDDDIKAISFVGSYTTTTHIYAQAVARGKRVEANIRYKNQAVVMPDACMDTTLDALVAAGFGAAGDSCTSLRSVIFVGCSAPWLEELVKRARELRVHEGTDESADIGPVISEEVKAKICRSVQNAVDCGASLILDGRNIVVPMYGKGSFVGPTILSGVTPSMEWFEEDLPGPLVLCTQVNSLEEAIAVVNQQKSKTGATIFTTSGFSAKKFQNEVEAGMVGINVPVSIPLPFSSTGLTTTFAGTAGVQFYTQVKLVAQQWKGLTSKRIPSTGTLTSERNSTHQAVSMSMHLQSDLSSHESSSSMSEASDTDMTDQERPVNRPPYDDSSIIRPVASLCQELDIDINLRQTSGWLETLTSTSRGTEDVPQCPERDNVTLIAQTSQHTNTPAPASYIPLPAQNNFMSHSISSKTDLSWPPNNGSLSSMASHSLQMNDVILLSTMERVSMASSSHRNEVVGSSHGSQGLGGFAFPDSGGREFIPTAYQAQWNGNTVPSLTDNGQAQWNRNTVSSLTDNGQGQWNRNTVPSLTDNGSRGDTTSERAYIGMASERVEGMFETQQLFRHHKD